MKEIKISLLNEDVFKVKADALILKFAQASHGLDREIVTKFLLQGISIDTRLPKIWDYFLTKSFGITNTTYILFVGVPPLQDFGYREIREFGQRSLKALLESSVDAKKVILTIHGPGYGLDEIEAFESQIAGIADSINSSKYPRNLEEILFIERKKGRFERLNKALYNLFPHGYIPTPRSGAYKEIGNASAEILRSVGYNSDTKKRIFVAMPFSSDFDDCFHYGIQGAVNSMGYLCERSDLQSFTGDVMEWVKNRIAAADFVIADLTTANPNVYLEVGYSWGKNKNVILLIKDTNELKFDTRGQRCLLYKSIKDLESKLKTELANLDI